MIYFIKKDDRIEKYKVHFDKEVLNRIKLEAIHYCSEIEHCEYEGTVEPNSFDYLKIRNYRRVKTGRTVPRDFYSQPEDIYHFSYDKYTYPYLIKLIDELLKGNAVVIDEILVPDYSKELSTFEERISRLKAEINKIDNLNTKEKVSKLTKLQELIEIAKSSNIQKPIAGYYTQVKYAITFEFVDSIEINEISKVISFFELSKSDIIKNNDEIRAALNDLIGAVDDE